MILKTEGKLIFTQFDIPREIIFYGKEDQKIIISLETGNVSIKGYTPNEASMAFWELVEKTFTVRR